MEVDLLGFDCTLFDIHFVAQQHDRDVVADTRQVLLPLRDVALGYPGSHVKHEDGTMSVDVVAVAQST